MITGLPLPTLVTRAGGVIGLSGTSLSVARSATEVTLNSSTGSGVSIPAASAASAGVLDAARAAVIDGLGSFAGSYNDLTDKPDRTAFLSLLIDGGGAAIVAPITRYLYVPFAGTLTGWTLLADQSGSMTIDIWREPLAAYPPTVANSICGGSPMQLTAADQASSLVLPDAWSSRTLSAGDVLALNVSASTTVQAVTAQLILTH